VDLVPGKYMAGGDYDKIFTKEVIKNAVIRIEKEI
jgi:hypothetical protein